MLMLIRHLRIKIT